MKLSLSVRIAEAFLSKEHAEMNLPALAQLARTAGYEALCMRASQVGVHTSVAQRQRAWIALDEAKLWVSMVTGDFDIVYNNSNGPNCLRSIEPYLELAQQMRAPMVAAAS